MFMKDIEKGTIKYMLIESITISIFGIILYPLFDFILCKFFTNSTFTYSIFDHIISPIMFGFIIGIFSWLFDRKKK